MDNEDGSTAFSNGAHKVGEVGIAFLMVDAQPVFDGDGNIHRVHHGFDTVPYSLRFRHQAGAKAPILYPVRRTAAVKVNLIVTPVHCQLRAFSQRSGFTTSQLQGQGMFNGVIIQVSGNVAVQKSTSGDHFGIESGVP